MSYRTVGGPLRTIDLDEPDCPPDGAVIGVRATGVCRSDWHAWRGHDPVPLPHVPGHEFAGVVLAVGHQVGRFTVGDRVTAPFVNGCGRCGYCLAGQAQVCPDQTQPGFTHHGSFAEQVVVHRADTNLVRLPDTLGFVTAASLGCRFATAFRALTGVAGLLDGEWLAVFGCGGVGLSAIQIGLALGARVLAVDPSDAAREQAARLGATVVTGHDPVAAIHRLTGGGAHVCLDAVGSAATAAAGVRSLRRQGRHVQVGLMLGADATAGLPWDLVVAHELRVAGSHGMAAVDYPAMLELVSSGRLDPAGLVARVIGFDELASALVALDSPDTGIGGLVVAELTAG